MTQQPQLTQSQPAHRVGTLFIVDDEMMVTASLQTMLSLETDHRIHCFNSPMDALAQVALLRPDVVISDFSMPGMDGIAFLRQVKSILPEATLILLTGYADKESAIQAINKVGIYRYIEKPWDNEDLKISIQNGLERSYLIHDLKQSVQDLTHARQALERNNQQLEAQVEARTQDLRTTFHKLQSIVNNTADGILTLNSALEITSINPAAERWLSHVEAFVAANANASSGKLSIHRLFRAVDDKGKTINLAELFVPGKPRKIGEVLIGHIPLEASIAPLLDDSRDESQGFVVVLRDILERKEIERLRDDFVSTLTHDLRTPLLAAIQTLGFFIDGSLGSLTTQQQELIQMLIQSNRELLGLVNVLLEVYKYESGRQKLIWDTVNLAELIGNIVQELEALAHNREQKLTLVLELENAHDVTSSSITSFITLGDKQELKRVFVNLIGNAINFTPQSGSIQVMLKQSKAPVVLEHLSDCSEMISICVSDNGRGIPAHDVPLLFQRFSQGTSKQRSSGSGLGLYLSRQIVEAHHGQIWVESEEGKGSRFYVNLPLNAS